MNKPASAKSHSRLITRVTNSSSASQVTVARLAGVSRAAVSLAFSGKGRIAERTRRRITSIADQIGYHPDINIEARRLSGRNSKNATLTKTIGLVWNVVEANKAMPYLG